MLSLAENGVIDAAEAKAILADAAAAHRGAAPLADGAGAEHVEAAALLEALIRGGNGVRRVRSRSAARDAADPGS